MLFKYEIETIILLGDLEILKNEAVLCGLRYVWISIYFWKLHEKYT